MAEHPMVRGTKRNKELEKMKKEEKENGEKTKKSAQKKTNELDFLKEIMDIGESKVHVLKALVGMLPQQKSEIFYQTVFAQREDRFTPVVLTSEGKLLKVYDNAELAIESITNEDGSQKYKTINQVPEELRYHYFKYGGMKYKFPHYLSFNDGLDINTVDNDAILDLKNDTKTGPNIYQEVKNEIKRYFYHDSKYEYDVLCSAVIQSYLYQLLGHVFYLVFLGEKGTGKTVGIGILSKLCYNGYFSGKTTVPVSCRLINFYGITLCQDEFEKISKEENKMLVGIFNSGFTKGGRYSLVNTNEKNMAKSITPLKVFSPKYFTANSIEEFDDSFIDRCYIIPSVKAKKTTNDYFSIDSGDEEQFQKIRNQIFNYCLLHWKDILAHIEYVKTRFLAKKEFGRKTDKLSIILGIILHFENESYAKKVRKYIKNKVTIDRGEDSETMDKILFNAIISRYSKIYSPIVIIPNKWLHDQLLKKLDMKKSDTNAPSNQKPGYILRKYGIISDESEYGYDKTGSRVFHIHSEKFRKALEKNKFNNMAEKIPPQPPQTPQSPQLEKE